MQKSHESEVVVLRVEGYIGPSEYSSEAPPQPVVWTISCKIKVCLVEMKTINGRDPVVLANLQYCFLSRILITAIDD